MNIGHGHCSPIYLGFKREIEQILNMMFKTHTDTDTQTHRHTDTQTHKHTDTQTDTQASRRQTDRQAEDRRTDIQFVCLSVCLYPKETDTVNCNFCREFSKNNFRTFGDNLVFKNQDGRHFYFFCVFCVLHIV